MRFGSQVMLAGETVDPDLKLDLIADRTESFSGSDLRALCTAAAMRPLRELLTASGKSSTAKVSCLPHPWVHSHAARMRARLTWACTGQAIVSAG